MARDSTFAKGKDRESTREGNLDDEMMDTTATTASTSEAKVTRLNVTDLSAEVLVDLFDYFRHKLVDRYGRFLEKTDDALELFRDVCSARLVCRNFKKFASPHLCPVLRLPLEKESFVIAEGISENPFILEGIHVIQISTLYRPKKLAESLDLFMHQRLVELGIMSDVCEPYAAIKSRSSRHKSNEVDAWTPLGRVYQEAMRNYNLMHSAWGKYSSRGYKETDNEKPLEYQRILRQGHTEYRTKHKEQMQLITNGSFASAVQSLVSQAPHPCVLEFDYTNKAFNRLHVYEPYLVLTNMEELSYYMSSPHEWETIEQLGGESDFAFSKLLASFPITFRQQGTYLHGLSLHCLPLFGNRYGFHNACGELSWDALGDACKQLRSFTYPEPNDFYHKLCHQQGEDRECINRFFSAMLSSSYLERIQLNLFCFDTEDTALDLNPAYQHLNNMDIGSALGTTHYPFLREAHISSVSIQRRELESFCRGLGENLQSLRMFCVGTDGSWVNTLEILHAKFSTRCLEGKCRIHLAALYGGEFGPRWSKTSEGSTYWSDKKPVIVDAQRYVNGDIGVSNNPLK